MKKFCVLFVGIVILAIAGISAYGTEEKPVESELGSYYEKAVDQENSETDVVMAVYKEKTVMKSVVEYQRKAQEALAGKPEGTGSSTFKRPSMRRMPCQRGRKGSMPIVPARG